MGAGGVGLRAFGQSRPVVFSLNLVVSNPQRRTDPKDRCGGRSRRGLSGTIRTILKHFSGIRWITELRNIWLTQTTRTAPTTLKLDERCAYFWRSVLKEIIFMDVIL